MANDIAVRTPLTHNDTDIAKAAAGAIESRLSIPADAVEVTVQNGTVTLRGTVDWSYQRRAAEAAVEYLRGVRHVSNLISVKQPKVSDLSVQGRESNGRWCGPLELDADRIRVRSENGHMTLSGTVRSFAEKEEAALAAWRAKGVTHVTNDIEVRPF